MSDHLQTAFALADDYRSRAAYSKATDTSGMLVGSGGSGVDAGYSKLTAAKEQFQHYKNWTYTAIKAIAQRIAGQSVCVGRMKSTPTGRKLANLPRGLRSVGDSIEPMKTHVLLEALNDPNPIMVRWSLMFSTVAALLLTGRSHWWLNDDGGEMQVWPIPAHWLRPNDQLRGSWMLRPDNSTDEFEVPNDDVVTFMLPDPSSPFGCVSPLQSQATAVATDEMLQTSQFRSFRDGIHPSVMIRVGRLPGMLPGEPGERPILEPEQRIQIAERVRALYAGVHRRNEPLIVDGLIEGVERLSSTAAEMDYLASGGQTKSRILQAFGLNPIVVGEVEGANRASAAVASQSFCETTVNPLCELLSESMTQWLARRYSPELVAWIEPCIANDDELTLNQWKAARQFGDVTTNEFRTHILNLPPMDGGDVRVDALGNAISEERMPKYLERSRNGVH